MGVVTDADYTHGKRVCKDFEINNLGKYHGFCVQSDTLFLANKIYVLELSHFLSASSLTW